MITAAAVGVLFPGPYRVPRGGFAAKSIYTNTVGRTAYRGPWQFESLAREVLLDIAARRMALDPAELRRRNLLGPDDLPYANPNGMTYDSISPLETFEQALAILDYDAFRAEQARRTRARSLPRRRHRLNYVEPSTPGFGYYATEAATIRIEPSGTVNVYIAGGSTGNSLETTVVQLAADALGCAIADVHTIQGDTAVTAFGAGTAGSRSGSMTAGAIRETAAILRDRIRAIAAHRLEAAVDDIELEESRAIVRGTPAVGVSLAEIAELAYFQPQSLPHGVPAGLEASARYTASSPTIWVNATHVCTCEVDIETGGVQLLRYIVSEDCGPMINPDVVEGQIAGGVAQGIGGVLFEHLAYDDDGNPLATTFLDYLVPSAAEVPPIEYGHIETPSPGPGGYKGVGEGGAIGAPPAVVNAVADALAPFGVTVTRLPLSPASIVELLHQEGDSVVTDVVLRPVRPRHRRRPVSGVEAHARRGAALLQRAVRLLRGEPLRGLRTRARRRTPVHLRPGRHPRAHQVGHRDAVGHADLRGPARAHRAPQPLVARVHAAAGCRARTQDTRVLRAVSRSAGRDERLRPHRRARRADADAGDRDAVRHPRGGPGSYPRSADARLRTEPASR